MPTMLPGDFGFLMQHVTAKGYSEDLAAPQLQQCGGDNDIDPYGAWCRELKPNSSLYFTVDNALHFSDGAQFRLVYLEDSPALALEVMYDNGSAHGANALRVTGGSSGQWKEATGSVRHSLQMAGKGPYGADVWVTNRGSVSARIHLVEVTKAAQLRD